MTDAKQDAAPDLRTHEHRWGWLLDYFTERTYFGCEICAKRR